MTEIHFTELLPEIVIGLNREPGLGFHVPVFIPNDLPTFLWPDNTLEQLIVASIDQAVSLNYSRKPIRIAIYKRTRLSDIETLLDIYPSYWMQLRIDVPSLSCLECCVQESLLDSGFRYEDEWAAEDGGSRLIAYSYEKQPVPAFLFWIQNRKASHSYSFLLPVYETGSRG